MSDPTDAIARAVLYEGHILWPYRASALKNRQRFTYGVVSPPAWSRRHPDDLSCRGMQCLLEGDERTTLAIEARFLHVVQRLEGHRSAGRFHAATGVLPWDEAIERGVTLGPLPLAELLRERSVSIAVRSGVAEEPLVRRLWRALRGALVAGLERSALGLFKVTARVENRGRWRTGDRASSLAHSFVSAHLVLRVTAGAFVSAIDPPPLADACRQQGLWPVLAGVPGDRRTMLALPLILQDWPQVAPESPGDLFDGGEIDELLTLSILALSDAEKAEMRATDPRAREILDRAAALGPEDFMRLHGRFRSEAP